MSEWEGKSKGTVTGYKIFIFLLKKVGINSTYFLLAFVSFYYYIFNFKRTRDIYKYFRYHRKNNFFLSIINSYKSCYVFGQTLIDKVAISLGMIDKYTFDFDGVENIYELAENKKGGIMISAHIGNFEVSQYFMDKFKKKIYLVTTDEEIRAIKNYLKSIMAQSKIDFITVDERMTHVFEIKNVLDNEEIICFTGDRFIKGAKIMETDFLEKKAKFPAGPFLISSKLGSPVLFVYVMREKNRHYHFYARKAEFKNRDANSLLESYVKSMETMLDKYPTQWFNYYDFWK